MEIKIYNTLTKLEEIFKPVEPGVLKMYSCGPTVYNYAHIGNLRAYIFMDKIVRIFKYNGYKIENAMNITDVGHLVSDEDYGEDKIAKAAKKENLSPFELARKYEEKFLEDMYSLNILKPKYILRATEHIKEMEEYVKKIIANGYAYETSDTIYFDRSKLNGKTYLSNNQNKIAGARIELDENKKNPDDFALWIKAPENHIMKWDSFFGMSYPGWHLECSCMSQKYLGNVFDIHTGGVDHIPVHHENEIVQSIGCTGKIPANYWMHLEFLTVDGNKMSKSLNNIYTLDTLKERGYSPLDFRYMDMLVSYRKSLNFTWQSIESAKQSLIKLRKGYLQHKNSEDTTMVENIKQYEEEFLQSINNDINISTAIAVVWKILKEKNNVNYAKLLEKFDNVLGFDLINSEKYLINDLDVKIPEEILSLAGKRKQAKLDKNYDLSDKIRDDILNKGYNILDNKDGTYQVIKKEK